MPQFINAHTSNGPSPLLHRAIALILVIFPVVYLSGQWLAAGKMGGQVLHLQPTTIALFFALGVTAYTALSGFRGAIYTDFVQSLFMLTLAAATALLTLINLVQNPAGLAASLTWGSMSLTTAIPFTLGFVILAITFNLGHPQMVTRFMSTKSPAAARKARFIYMAFLQFTFLTYILFGTLLHAMLSQPLADPEQGLATFISQYGFPGMAGLLIAGAIATIASTASALTATIGEMLRNDLLPTFKLPRVLTLAAVGIASIVIALNSSGSVFGLIIGAVSLIGATMAAPMLVIIFGGRPSTDAILSAIITGFTAGTLTILSGLSSTLNESAPGLLTGLLTLWVFQRYGQPAPTTVRTSARNSRRT